MFSKASSKMVNCAILHIPDFRAASESNSANSSQVPHTVTVAMCLRVVTCGKANGEKANHGRWVHSHALFPPTLRASWQYGQLLEIALFARMHRFNRSPQILCFNKRLQLSLLLLFAASTFPLKHQGCPFPANHPWLQQKNSVLPSLRGPSDATLLLSLLQAPDKLR